MNITVEELLEHLEKSENEEQIKHLANLENIKYVENVKEIGGLAGVLTKFVMLFTKKHMEALMALSKCKNAADIAEFRKTKHFERIKDNEMGGVGYNLEELEKLKELENLENWNL